MLAQNGTYQVTNDGEQVDSPYSNTPDGIDTEEMYYRVTSGDRSLEKELLQLIHKYPDTAIFHNYLSSLYEMLGKTKKYNKILMATFNQFPDYLFCQVNMAREYLRNDNLEKVTEILGEALSIGMRFPNRKVFHVSEFENFYDVVFNYYFSKKDYKNAIRIFELFDNELHEDRPAYSQLKELANNVRTLSSLERLVAENEPLRKLEEKRATNFKFKSKLPKQTTATPLFESAFFTELVANDTVSDWDSFIESTNNIPREVLVKDISTALLAMQERYHWWLKKNDAPNLAKVCFILIGHYKMTELMDDIVGFLEQDDEFINHWLDSFGTAELPWQLLVVLFSEDLEQSTKLLYKPWLSLVMLEDTLAALSYLFTQEGTPKSQVKKILIDFIDYSLKDNNGAKYEPEIWSRLSIYCLETKCVEIYEKLKPIFDKDWFYSRDYTSYGSMVDDFDFDYESRFTGPYYSWEKLFQLSLSTGDEVEVDLDDDDGFMESLKRMSNDAALYDFLEEEPSYPTRKIGRNEPCPCGSGKKYKKCCG